MGHLLAQIDIAQIDVAGVDVVDQIWWYLSRAAGIVAWVLLSGSVIAGMSITTRDARRMPAGWPLDLHRFLSTLAISFLTIHLLTLVPDNFIHFGLVELLVPMASEWRPGSVAWGIVAFWLVVCVEVSSLLRQRLPNRVWRSIHMFSFVVWISATVHLFYAGTDVGHPIFRVAQAVVITTVTILFIRRILLVVRKRRSGTFDQELARVGALPVEEPVNIDEVDPWERRELRA